MKTMTVTKQSLLEDVKNHKMTVLVDTEVSRILRFDNHLDGMYWFDIVTWGRNLVITGDCGTYVFCRSNDMFDFFRGRHDPDLAYLAEKLVAVDKRDGHEKYDEETFRERVLEWAEEFAAEYFDLEEGVNVDERKLFFERINEEVLCDLGSQGMDLSKALYFEWDGHLVFQDFWEVDLTEYTPRFVWCCHAIVWAIDQYDKMKETEK